MNRRVLLFLCVVSLSLSMIACSEKKETAAPKQEAAAPQAVPLSVFKQEISSLTPPQTLKVDEGVTIKVSVKNTGNEPWPIMASDEKGANRVNLGFQWLDGAGKVIKEHRVALPSALMPESSITLDVNIQAPSKPGNYKLRFSMVQEFVAWFNDKGASPLTIEISVKSQEKESGKRVKTKKSR